MCAPANAAVYAAAAAASAASTVAQLVGEALCRVDLLHNYMLLRVDTEVVIKGDKAHAWSKPRASGCCGAADTHLACLCLIRL